MVIPPRLRAQYPEEMTIVLQHQFWDLGIDPETDILRVGRVSLMYQTLDAKETGYWDSDGKKWVADNSYRSAITAGLKVAKKQAAPDFIEVAIHAPKEVS